MSKLRDELDIVETVKEWKMKRDKVNCKKFDTILNNIQSVKIESDWAEFMEKLFNIPEKESNRHGLLLDSLQIDLSEYLKSKKGALK